MVKICVPTWLVLLAWSHIWHLMWVNHTMQCGIYPRRSPCLQSAVRKIVEEPIKVPAIHQIICWNRKGRLWTFEFNLSVPSNTILVDAMADKGCQSYLAGSKLIKKLKLAIINMEMHSADNHDILILGAIILRLSGKDQLRGERTTQHIGYITDSTDKLFLSREHVWTCALFQLNSLRYLLRQITWRHPVLIMLASLRMKSLWIVIVQSRPSHHPYLLAFLVLPLRRM